MTEDTLTQDTREAWEACRQYLAVLTAGKGSVESWEHLPVPMQESLKALVAHAQMMSHGRRTLRETSHD